MDNIMNTLTPKPSFDPKKKNTPVVFTLPKVSIVLKATNTKFKGINRTKDNIKI